MIPRCKWCDTVLEQSGAGFKVCGHCDQPCDMAVWVDDRLQVPLNNACRKCWTVMRRFGA